MILTRPSLAAQAAIIGSVWSALPSLIRRISVSHFTSLRNLSTSARSESTTLCSLYIGITSERLAGYERRSNRWKVASIADLLLQLLQSGAGIPRHPVGGGRKFRARSRLGS